MPIIETHLVQPVCEICGPLSPLRERPLRDAENELDDHERDAHNSEPEDA